MNEPTAPTVRTAPPIYQGGRIYECDPAAVERLKSLMAQQQRQRDEAEAARLARQNDHAARLRAEAKRRKAQQAAAESKVEAKPKPQPKPKPPKKHGRGRRQFTAAQLAAAVAAHNSGQTWRKVAAGMGVARCTLRQALADAGYDIHNQMKIYRGRARRVTDDMTRAAHARQLAGEQLKDIAAEYGMTPQLLNRHFKRLGLPSVKALRRSDRNAPPAPRRRYNDAQAQVALTARESGKLWREIAADMGVPRSTMRGWVKEYKARQ